MVPMNVTLNVTPESDGLSNRDNTDPVATVYSARRADWASMMHRCGADDSCVVEQRGSHSDAAGAGSMPDRSL
jgi:hypothetical protein